MFPCAWFECCRENVTVFHGPKEEGRVIGRVTQSCCGGCCTPKLNVLSKKGERELMVKGPCIIGDCCGVKFDVLTDKKKKVRYISDPSEVRGLDFSLVAIPARKRHTTSVGGPVILREINQLLWMACGGKGHRNIVFLWNPTVATCGVILAAKTTCK